MDKLHPKQKQRFVKFVESLKERTGLDIRVSETYRDKLRQFEMFKQGTSKVKFPYSWHNHGLAIDIYNNVPGNLYGFFEEEKNRKIIREQCKEFGLEWGFDLWGWDKPHFQFTNNKNINDVVNKPSIINDFPMYEGVDEQRFLDWAASVGLPSGATLNEIKLLHSAFKHLETKYK